MDIDQLKTFVAVVTFGGFRRAAEVLFLSQPAVSARIKALEGSLAVKLFERGRDGLQLSTAGRAFRPHAEHLLQELAIAQQAVREAEGATGGVLRIAAALSICTYLLPHVLKAFRAEHPKVLITLQSGHSKQVLEIVLRGEAEIGLARSLYHPLVETVRLGDDPLLLVAEPQHRPAQGHGAQLAQVADWPLIFFDRGSSDWTLTHGLFRRAGLVPNVVLEVETIEAAKRMVERGLGVAFLPRLAVAADLKARRLVAIELYDSEPLGRSLDSIHSKQRPQSAEAKAFLHTLRATVQTLVGGRRPAPGGVRKRSAAG
jgi:LysR family transcriptional regulator, low CO2-responsive transcriptional regulator